MFSLPKIAASPLLGLAGLTLAAILPTQAFAAYTCSNPAICIAVCGKRTCGAFKAADRDLQTLEARLAKISGRAKLKAASGTQAGYTCWNPAICKAVCGSTTC